MSKEKKSKKKIDNLPISERISADPKDDRPFEVPKYLQKKKSKALVELKSQNKANSRVMAEKPLKVSKKQKKRVTLGTESSQVPCSPIPSLSKSLSQTGDGIFEEHLTSPSPSQRSNSRCQIGGNILENLNTLLVGSVECELQTNRSQLGVVTEEPRLNNIQENINVANSIADILQQSDNDEWVDAEVRPRAADLAEGVNPEMLLLLLPFEKWGTCLGFQQASHYVPNYLWDRIRKIHIHFGESLVNAHHKAKTGQEDVLVMYWKKYLLLPLLLHTYLSRKELIARISKLERNEWHFKVKDLLRTYKPRTNYVSIRPSSKNFKIAKALKLGQVSKAMQFLNQAERSGLVDKDNEFIKLATKYPHPVRGQEWAMKKQVITSFKIPNDQKLRITPAKLKAVVGKCKNMTRPGIDQLKFEHVKTLVGDHFGNQDRNEQIYTSMLAHVVELIANADYPVQVGYAFRDNELIGIPKNNSDDVRPIAMGSTYRKFASKLWFQKLYDFNKTHFAKYQYGLKEKAMEQIIHSLKLNWERHQDYDVYLVDAENAFNSIDRVNGLTEVKNHFPGILPFLSAMYLEDSNCWFHGKTDMIANIKSDEGFHQGDVLSSWLYVLSLQPMLHLIDQRVKAKFGPDCHYEQFWYIDDGTILAPRSVMLEIIKTIRDEGPYYGYHINLKKGAYLIGKCATGAEALAARTEVCETVDIPLDKFAINPEHYDYNDEEVNTFNVNKYGAVVLGSPIGSDSYIKDELMCFVRDELETVAKNLIDHESVQERWILFTKSFMLKPLHLFKTISPRLTTEFINAIDLIGREILCSMLDCSIDELSEQIIEVIKLPIEKGGLGLKDYADLGTAAYAASLHDNNILFGDMKLFETTEFIPHVVDFVNAVGEIKREDGFHHTVDTLTEMLNKKENGETSQHVITNMLVKERAIKVETLVKSNKGYHHWFKSIQNSQSGKWLESVPSNPKLTLSNEQFTTALRYRLYMHYEGWSSMLVCGCGKDRDGKICKTKIIVDRHGDHLATGCNLNNLRTTTHDSIVDTVRGLLNYTGYRTIKEQKRLFGDNGRRPDITICDYKGKIKKMLLDISIPATLNYHVNGDLNINKCNGVGKNAEKMFNKKNEEYLQSAIANSHDFKPFIIESCGIFHPDTYDFIKELAKKKEKNLICKQDTMLNYMLKCISVSLQAALANSIRKRYNSLIQLNASDVVQIITDMEVYHSVSHCD